MEPPPRPLHVVTAGAGRRAVLVHGSAADHTTWTIQLASPALRGALELVAYDRRAGAATIEAHADDLAALIEGRAATDRPLTAAGPVIAVGSSFGAVVVLDLARRRPDLVRGAILCEPPLPAADGATLGPAGFIDDLDRRAAAEGPEAAAAHFLRSVLGDAAFERMPRLYKARSCAMWPAIRSDCVALAAYLVRYAELPRVDVPVLLLGGDRSAGYFRPTLEALAAHLPRARLETLAGAGHMMQADAHRSFAEHLLGFAAQPSP